MTGLRMRLLSFRAGTYIRGDLYITSFSHISSFNLFMDVIKKLYGHSKLTVDSKIGFARDHQQIETSLKGVVENQ